MSLQGIFDPMVRAYFEEKYAGGGGGSTVAVWHSGGEYRKLDELVKISDLAPTIEELTGGIYVAHSSGSTGAAKIEAADMDGQILIVAGDNYVAAVIPKEFAEAHGDATLAGLWLLSEPTDYDEVWICWEP